MNICPSFFPDEKLSHTLFSNDMKMHCWNTSTTVNTSESYIEAHPFYAADLKQGQTESDSFLQWLLDEHQEEVMVNVDL